jgi:hypothetical protein
MDEIYILIGIIIIIIEISICLVGLALEEIKERLNGIDDFNHSTLEILYTHAKKLK